MLHIFVDADACPVKEEVYRVANRYSLNVTLVANSWMRIPDGQSVVLKVVGGDFDEADNWIVEQVQPHDIVITIDVLLAERCLKKGARVISSNGKSFTEENIGDTVATRNLMAELRSGGEITGGPAPFKKSDRSNFLQELNEVIQSIQRKH
ncbi:MAG: YaiI/YqxD family protein [Candidatus Omnitrophica bacterium]|nr:YaiI/YqxD family protein [Candidatus Omnitrophota bacterium]